MEFILFSFTEIFLLQGKSRQMYSFFSFSHIYTITQGKVDADYSKQNFQIYSTKPYLPIKVQIALKIQKLCCYTQ